MGAQLRIGTVAHCRSCDAEMLWAVTLNGSKMPLDPVPTDAGNMVVCGHVGGVPLVHQLDQATLGRGRAVGTLELYLSHHVTCPHGDQWRKR